MAQEQRINIRKHRRNKILVENVTCRSCSKAQEWRDQSVLSLSTLFMPVR